MVVRTMWLCLASRQNVIKLTPALAGRGGGREAKEGGVHLHKLNVGMPVSLGMPLSLQAMVMLRMPRDLIHENRL